MRPARMSVTFAAFSLTMVGALVAPASAQPEPLALTLEGEAFEEETYDPEFYEEPVVDPSWEPPAADVWDPEPLEEVTEIGAPPDELWAPADLDLEEIVNC